MFCWDGPHRLSCNEVLTTRRSLWDSAAAILKSWPRTSVRADDGVSQILTMMSLMKAEQSRALIREKIGGIAVVVMALIVALPVLAQETPPVEPEGYRLENYHAPTPATLKGATVIDTARAFDIWNNKGAVFVDTVAHPTRPADLPKEASWQAATRLDIPGSIWLVDTGFGELTTSTLRYFESGLVRATANDKSKSLVFYCRTNCWASWNAAKRSLSLGYKNVSWYPGGADGWEKAGHPLEERQPEPRD